MSDVIIKEVVTIPLGIIESEVKSPKELIIFSKPKVGKTTILAQLPGCLLLDLEDGSDYVSAMKYKVNSVKEMEAFAKAVHDAGYPYKAIAIDTATGLEEIATQYAEVLYMRSPMGKNWLAVDGGKSKYGSILNLPDGAGYKWLRDGFEILLKLIRKLAPRVIMSAHVKDIMLDKEGSEFTSADLDLTGKLKRIAASNSDAIGYLYRKGKQTILSFKTSDKVACGARPAHLQGQEIVIAEEIDGKVVTYWDRVYID